MGFQRHINQNQPSSKQNMHLIGYVVGGESKSISINSSLIIDADGSINVGQVTSLIAGMHSGSAVMILSVSDIGLQSV